MTDVVVVVDETPDVIVHEVDGDLVPVYMEPEPIVVPVQEDPDPVIFSTTEQGPPGPQGIQGVPGQQDNTPLVVLAPAASARNVIQPTGPGVTPLVVKGAATQSANLFEAQDSTGAVKVSISAAGSVIGQNIQGNLLYGGTLLTTGGVTRARLQAAGNAGGNFQVPSQNPTDIPLVVKGAATQSADLFEAQDSSGGIGARVGPSANSFGVGPYFADAVGRLSMSGSAGEFSIADRVATSFVQNPTTGQRFVQYVNNGAYKVWSGNDILTLGYQGNLTVNARAATVASLQHRRSHRIFRSGRTAADQC
jgi:hypothetical protein